MYRYRVERTDPLLTGWQEVVTASSGAHTREGDGAARHAAIMKARDLADRADGGMRIRVVELDGPRVAGVVWPVALREEERDDGVDVINVERGNAAHVREAGDGRWSVYDDDRRNEATVDYLGVALAIAEIVASNPPRS